MASARAIKHWHVCLGTNENYPQVDYIIKDGPASITAYLDLCQNFFRKEFQSMDRQKIELALLEAYGEDTEQSAIMRSYVYCALWVPCSGCRTYSLN